MAEATALAGVEDVKALLGRDLTVQEASRAAGVLSKASNLFRREAGQAWAAGSEIVRLKSNGGRLLLAQRNVETVASVIDDHGRAVEYTQRGQWLDTSLASHQFATVDYSFDGAVPDLVREAVADIARAVLLLDAAAVAGAAASTESKGPFSRTTQYAGWAQGGQTRLSPDDVALARSYRPVGPRVHVMRAPTSERPWHGGY